MTDDKEILLPVHHCPTCGLDTPALDPMACPECGTFMDWPRKRAAPKPPRDMRFPADDWDEQLAVRVAVGERTRKLQANQRPAGTVTELERKRALRAEMRREVHRLRDEGLSIAQTARKLSKSESYVSQLRREPLD